MGKKTSIYEKTYRNYLSQIGDIDFNSLGEKLQIKTEGSEAQVPLFGKTYNVSPSGILDPHGKQPPFDICVILCKYLLLCPDIKPRDNDWVSFRGLKDSGPLINYFSNDVEKAISSYFSGKLELLKEAARGLGGYVPDIESSYDLCMEFSAFPMIPVIMLFNDTDDEFPSTCSILFERRAEKYLDAECIAIAGRLLFQFLKSWNRF